MQPAEAGLQFRIGTFAATITLGGITFRPVSMKRSRTGSFSLAFLLLVVGGTVSACQRQDPLDRAISARTPVAFVTWQQDARFDLTPEQWQDFDVAVQELKFRIMTGGAATGSEDVDEALRAEIDGQSVRHVTRDGLRAKLVRIREDRDETTRMIAENTTIPTAGADPDAIANLRALLARQTARLEANEAEIKSLEARLKRFGPGASSGSP